MPVGLCRTFGKGFARWRKCTSNRLGGFQWIDSSRGHGHSFRQRFTAKNRLNARDDLLRGNEDWCAGIRTLELRADLAREPFQRIGPGKDQIDDLRGDT